MIVIRISATGLFLIVCFLGSLLTFWSQFQYNRYMMWMSDEIGVTTSHLQHPHIYRETARTRGGSNNLQQKGKSEKEKNDPIFEEEAPNGKIPDPPEDDSEYEQNSPDEIDTHKKESKQVIEEEDDRPLYLKDESVRAMMFHNAHWMADSPDIVGHERNYMENDEYFRVNSSLIYPYKMPVDINGTQMINHTNTEHPILTGLRYMHSAKHRREGNQLCHRYRFNNSIFPTMSVIVTVQNERAGLLAFTIHSLLARTPPEILKEIIIVDDNGMLEEERVTVDTDELKHLSTLHPKVKIITHKEKKGCAGSRLSGARVATGEVLMFVDSHIEMYSSTWAQHLLLPILENPRTVAMQSLHILDDRKGFNRFAVGTHNSYGVINDQFIFSYVTGKYDSAEMPTTRLPYETVYAPGSLFAIRKEEFLRLGEYDEGLIVWGAENLELAMKVHMCGYDGKGPPGRIVMVPCSNVGHVYRIHTKEDQLWPPPVPEYLIAKYNLLPGNQSSDIAERAKMAFERVIVRNNFRIMKVWIGQDHYLTQKYYKLKTGKFPNETLGPKFEGFRQELEFDPNIKKQMEIKKKNKCKSFDWFDENVFYKYLGIHNPFHPSRYKKADVSCGGAKHTAQYCGKCPRGRGSSHCNGDCHWCSFGAFNSSETDFLESFDERGNLFFELQEPLQCIDKNIECRPGLPDTLKQRKVAFSQANGE